MVDRRRDDRGLACAAACALEHVEASVAPTFALGVGGNLVSEEHRAALAIEHGVELLTFDSDFARWRHSREC